jgi:hypothetical protein
MEIRSNQVYEYGRKMSPLLDFYLFLLGEKYHGR